MLKLRVIPIEAAIVTNDKIPEIYVHETPSTTSWSLLPLYKMTFHNGLVSWQISYDNQRPDVFTIHTDDENNNINSTTVTLDVGIPDIVAARRHYCNKYHEGYRPAGESTATMADGMKGYNYKLGSAINWPVYVQPKLHGVRMLCQDNGQAINMRSYENTPYTHLTHIAEELKEFFAYLPRFAILDGELYNHSMSFSKLISIIKTRKYVHPQLTDVSFHIFDINYQPKEPFEKRYELLVNAFRKYIQDRSSTYREDDTSVLPRMFTIVSCNNINNHEELVQIHNNNVRQGYEGSVLKKLSNGNIIGSKLYNESLYYSQKCNHILKHKDFEDEEATITSIVDSNTIMVCDTRNNMFVLSSRIPVTHDAIGKHITYRFHRRNQGIPEFPIVVAIRDYE